MRFEDALAQLARETGRARRRMALERVLRAWLASFLAAGAWALLALTGAHGLLPLMGQSLTAMAALAGFALLTLRALRNWRAPSEEEARARLAANSRLDAGAFESLRDQPIRYDAFAMALWRRARERALEQAENLRAGPPRPELDEIDRYKLRYVLAAALIAGAVYAGADGSDRLARAFLPDLGPLLGDQPMAIEAWASPADYTHSAPVSLSDLVGERVVTPPTIEVTVRVTGPSGAPCLVFEGAGQRRSERFTRAADGAWEARLAIPNPGRLSIVRFHRRAFWRLAPAADVVPSAALTAPISVLPEERAAIAWRASDDFGIRRLLLRVRPVAPPPGLTRADPIDTELEAPAGDPREAEAETEIDLAAHAYAGMEVEARLVAVDGLGQEGVSEPLHFTLPEKVFLQPLARAAIEIRRHVLAERRPYRPAPRARRQTIPAGDIVLGNQRLELRDYERRPALSRAPQGVRRAARLLDALTADAGDAYFRDMAVYLGLRLARSELAVARESGETEVAAATLWHTALRAEYGGGADTRRALEEAERQLAEALEQNAPRERIQQLTDALRQATARAMQALVQEALRNGESENLEDTEEQAQISGRDIEQMLRDVERLSEQGRNAEAQAELRSLADILSRLDVQVQQSQSEGQSESSDDQRMQDSMDTLSRAMEQMQALREETRREQQEREQQQGGGGGQQEGGQGGDQLADRQAQIREGLAQAQSLADESGAAPSPDLDAAGQAMRQAENALRRGDIEGARNAQAAAMESLRKGAEALGSQKGEPSQQRAGAPDGVGALARDPLGRLAAEDADSPVGGASDGRDQHGAGVGDPATTRAVFDDIVRRAQDPNRPEAEREYLRRLLDRFGDS